VPVDVHRHDDRGVPSLAYTTLGGSSSPRSSLRTDISSPLLPLSNLHGGLVERAVGPLHDFDDLREPLGVEEFSRPQEGAAVAFEASLRPSRSARRPPPARPSPR
jgi:hypothetical protein